MTTETTVNLVGDIILQSTDIYRRISEKAKPSFSTLYEEHPQKPTEEESAILARLMKACRYESFLLGSNLDLRVNRWLPPFGYAMIVHSDTTIHPGLFIGSDLYHGFSMCMVKKPGGGRIRDEDILVWKKRVNILVRDDGGEHSPIYGKDEPLGGWIPSLGSNSWIGFAEYQDTKHHGSSTQYVLYVKCGLPDKTMEKLEEYWIQHAQKQSYKDFTDVNLWCNRVASEVRARLLYLFLLALGLETDHPKETRMGALYPRSEHPPTVEWLQENGFKQSQLAHLPAFLSEPKRVPKFCTAFLSTGTPWTGGMVHPMVIQPMLDVFTSNMMMSVDSSLPKDHILVTSGRCWSGLDLIPKITGPKQWVRVLELNPELKEDSKFLYSIPCLAKQQVNDREGFYGKDMECQDVFWEDDDLKKNALCESTFHDDILSHTLWQTNYPKIKTVAGTIKPILVRVSCVDSFHEVKIPSPNTKKRFDQVDGKDQWDPL